MDIDDKYLEFVIDLIDGKREVSDECKEVIIKQGRRLIWLDREKQKRKAIKVKMENCEGVDFHLQ